MVETTQLLLGAEDGSTGGPVGGPHVRTYDLRMSRWWRWLQRELDVRGWKPVNLSEKLGINSSVTTRWKAGATPTPDTARRVAEILDVPYIDALLAAEVVTEHDLEGVQISVSPLESLSDEALLAELGRRMDDYRAALESEDEEAAGSRQSSPDRDTDPLRRPSTDVTWSSRTHPADSQGRIDSSRRSGRPKN